MTLNNKVEDILTLCPHYYDVVDLDFNDTDQITKHIISEYRIEMFNIADKNAGTLNRLRVLDIVMQEFIKKDKFFAYAKEQISKQINDNALVLSEILDALIVIYKNYIFKKEYIKNQEDGPRWL